MKETPFRIFSFAALLCMVLLSACSAADDIQQTPTRHKVSITATQPSTRMGYDSNGTGYWQEGDTIAVWSSGDNTFEPFVIASGAGEAKATFKGKVKGEISGETAVLYPYHEKHTQTTYYLPDAYVYASVDKEYSVKDGSSFRMPMRGAVTIADSKVHTAYAHAGLKISNFKMQTAKRKTSFPIVTKSMNKRVSNHCLH